MKTRILLAVVVACGLGLDSSQLYAQEKNIHAVLELSGIKEQVDQIPAGIQAGLTQRQEEGNDLNPRDFKKLSKIMNDSYRADLLYQSIVDHFKKNYDEGRIAAMLKMLRSPLARRMTRLEVQASTPEALQEIQAYTQHLEKTPPSPDRMDLVQRLDEVSQATELSVEIQTLTVMGLLEALNAASLPEDRLDQDQIEQMYGNMRAELEDSLKTFTVVFFLYTYRSVPDSDLKKYIKYYESDEGKWFTKQSHAALKNAISQAAKRAGNQIAKTLGKKNTS